MPDTRRGALAVAWAGDYDRRGQFARVRERDVEFHPALFGNALGRTVQAKRRRGIPAALNLHLVQAQSSEPERFQRRLLGRESRGEVAPGPWASSACVQLTRGEDPLGERWTTFERTLDPFDFDQVYAGAARRHSARRRT